MTKWKVGDRVGLRWAPSHTGTVKQVKRGGWIHVAFDKGLLAEAVYRGRDLVNPKISG